VKFFLAGRRGAVAGAALAVAVVLSACSANKKPDKVTKDLLSQPKEVLFQKGKDLLAKKKTEDARKYLNFVFESYPNDPLGQKALLRLADSYFQQRGRTGFLEARYRYRDYVTRYPSAPERDFALYRSRCYDREPDSRPRPDERGNVNQYNAAAGSPGSGYARATSARGAQGPRPSTVRWVFYLGRLPEAALGRFLFADYRTRRQDKLLYTGRALDRSDEKTMPPSILRTSRTVTRQPLDGAFEKSARSVTNLPERLSSLEKDFPNDRRRKMIRRQHAPILLIVCAFLAAAARRRPDVSAPHRWEEADVTFGPSGRNEAFVGSVVTATRCTKGAFRTDIVYASNGESGRRRLLAIACCEVFDIGGGCRRSRDRRQAHALCVGTRWRSRSPPADVPIRTMIKPFDRSVPLARHNL
jgi:hypothetical protein